MKKLQPIPVAGAPEQWVDLSKVAEHLNFSYALTRRMAQEGTIPGVQRKCGKKVYWRFKLSVVDAALLAEMH